MPTNDQDVNRIWAIRGEVVHGHGRGGTQLGFPTANVGLNDETTQRLMPFQNWVYYGWGVVEPSPTAEAKAPVTMVPVVMSVGFNPHFQDKSLTVEAHFLKRFDEDFYGSTVRVVSCGALRQQGSFSGLEQLIEAIKTDCRVAHERLAEGDGQKVKNCSFLTHANYAESERPLFQILGAVSSL